MFVLLFLKVSNDLVFFGSVLKISNVVGYVVRALSLYVRQYASFVYGHSDIWMHFYT